ncbi:MAG: hypothetical protein PQJ49_01460 [Sphaerochaetaceae bacterium]|nr:hypothetical protein [Sphaerochaetaceae bacterium]
MNKELIEKSEQDLIVAKKFTKIHQSARSRDLEFAMTLREVKRLLNCKTCYFTGKPLNNIEGDPLQLTFDRIDNTKGYVNGNVVACSNEFNNIKDNITIEQVRLMVKAFKRKKIW